MNDLMPAEASEYARFLKHWRAFPSHEYLERAAGLLARLDIRADDPRLCAGTPKGTAWAFPITLNQRYVLAARLRQRQIGVVLRRFDPSAPYASHLGGSFDFRPFRDEADPPVWRTVGDLSTLDDPLLAAEWEAGAAYEAARRTRSGFRRCNNAFLAELLTDEETRIEWREEAKEL